MLTQIFQSSLSEKVFASPRAVERIQGGSLLKKFIIRKELGVHKVSVALQTDRDFGKICLEICLLLVYQPKLFPHVLIFGTFVSVNLCRRHSSTWFSIRF